LLKIDGKSAQMAHFYIKSGAFIKMLFFDRFRDVESEFKLMVRAGFLYEVTNINREGKC
jgi:hypothetical protein